MNNYKCKKCGNEDIFYLKQQIKGSCNYRFHNDNKIEVNNSSMHDNLEYSGGKNVYCDNCNSYVGKNVDY